ncbi:unnamed protein product [Sphenostylis stenocarpa]|uniref:Uncharacterized protein n=1 Tax=Sphenostylis stenocarpa TaxID=92480 RepID=A0AA86VXT4_9FABA|nr:unnamed protein product [Sphenostylis stenocarpa]
MDALRTRILKHPSTHHRSFHSPLKSSQINLFTQVQEESVGRTKKQPSINFAKAQSGPQIQPYMLYS